MPVYEYKCKSCGAVSEFLVHGYETGKIMKCSACGSEELEKMLSVPGYIKSGSRTSGGTCCGSEARCDTPPCSSGGSCCHEHM